jgi:hypothetical protein
MVERPCVFLCAVQLSPMKGSWPTPAFALGLVFFDQLGFSHSGPCWLMYRGPLSLLINRCPEIPRGYNPNSSLRAFYDHEVIVKVLRCMCVMCGFVVMIYSSFVA